ncbi:hypothetical protein JMUB6875_59950 [Nocardia sp. JMUB6875]
MPETRAKLRRISDNPGPSVPFVRLAPDYLSEKSRDAGIGISYRGEHRSTPNASVQMCLHLHEPEP